MPVEPIKVGEEVKLRGVKDYPIGVVTMNTIDHFCILTKDGYTYNMNRLSANPLKTGRKFNVADLLFCDNCTDIWYDWNGPYMIMCNKDLPTDVGFKGQCKEFIEENPIIISEKQYIKDLKERKEQAKKFAEEHKEELDKIVKAYLDSLIYGVSEVKGLKL